MTANSKERPYKPSWVDRFTNWVEKLPMPGWVFYVGLGLGLVLIQVLSLWLDGGLTVAEVLLPVIIFNALLIPFGLALIHLLDDQAVAALESMRSTLEMTEPESHGFRLYHCFVGIVQQVNSVENDTIGYHMVLEQAREKGDRKVVDKLTEQGPPPYTKEESGAYKTLFSRLPSCPPSICSKISYVCGADCQTVRG